MTAVAILPDPAPAVDSALAAAHARAAAIERDAFRAAFAPRERMSLLEWATTRRWMSPEANALAADAKAPVRYTLELTPYHREIMEALSDPRTEYVACMLPSQADGKTELLLNFFGWKIDTDPGPMLAILPDLELAQTLSKDRLAPMIRDCPTLRSRVRDPRARDSSNTILHKLFPGGHWTAVGSNSPAGVSARPIRDVMVDEADRCAKSAGTEGDSIGLGFRRTTTFRRSKKGLFSSPTDEHGRIVSEFKLGTQEVFEVPCIHCDEYFEPIWGSDVPHGMKWDRDPNGKPLPETAHYVCEHCGGVIQEHHKAAMIDRYRFRVDAPEQGPRRRSFRKNAIFSKLNSWRKLVAEWIEVQAAVEKLQQFVNTVLCELWTGRRVISSDTLTARLGIGYPADNAEGVGTVPAGVAVLVRTVDVQDDRNETAVWGFGAGIEAWLIDWELYPGSPGTPAPWHPLHAALFKRYRHASGAELRPLVTFVDSGGHFTQEVYNWTRARNKWNVFAIKGSNIEGHPLLGKPTRNNSSATILYPVGSFTGKETLLTRLTLVEKPGPGYIHLPEWLDAEQVEQFTRLKIERVVPKGGRGKRRRVVVESGAVEQAHLYVYALAALQKLGLKAIRDLGAIAAQLMARGAASTPASGSGGTIPSTPARPAGRRMLSGGIE